MLLSTFKVLLYIIKDSSSVTSREFIRTIIIISSPADWQDRYERRWTRGVSFAFARTDIAAVRPNRLRPVFRGFQDPQLSCPKPKGNADFDEYVCPLCSTFDIFVGHRVFTRRISLAILYTRITGSSLFAPFNMTDFSVIFVYFIRPVALIIS